MNPDGGFAWHCKPLQPGRRSRSRRFYPAAAPRIPRCSNPAAGQQRIRNNGVPDLFAMNRRHYAIPLQQATQESPTLARLTALTRESSERLKAIEALIPPMLRPALQAGPIEGTCWCLLVRSNAAAAKIRQLLPAFQAHLRSRGWEVHSIRLKIQS